MATVTSKCRSLSDRSFRSLRAGSLLRQTPDAILVKTAGTISAVIKSASMTWKATECLGDGFAHHDAVVTEMKALRAFQVSGP